MPFRILHVGPVQAGKIAGLSKSIPSHASAQAAAGASVALLNSANRPASLQLALELIEWPIEDDRLTEFGLVVFHSTYLPRHVWLARRLRSLGIPYVIAPEGGLTRVARSRKRLKKALADILAFNRFVRGAIGIEFLSRDEALSSYFLDRPWIVSGNGVELPPVDDLARPHLTVSPVILFLGRIDVHIKGLDLLLKAASLAAEQIRQQRGKVVLVGPASSLSRRLVGSLIRSERIADIVEVRPAINRPEISDVLRSASLFVHTSRTEGLPNAVLEAMAHGLPVLITPGTNLGHDVASLEAGWVCSPEPSDICKAIIEALGNPDERRRRGANARRLAAERFSWSEIASRSLDGYSKLLGSQNGRNFQAV